MTGVAGVVYPGGWVGEGYHPPGIALDGKTLGILAITVQNVHHGMPGDLSRHAMGPSHAPG